MTPVQQLGHTELNEFTFTCDYVSGDVDQSYKKLLQTYKHVELDPQTPVT